GGNPNLLLLSNSTKQKEFGLTKFVFKTPFPEFPVKLFLPENTELVKKEKFADSGNLLKPYTKSYSTAVSSTTATAAEDFSLDTTISVTNARRHATLSSFQCPSLVNFYGGASNIARREVFENVNSLSVDNVRTAANFYNPFLSLKENEEKFLARSKYFLIYAKSKFFQQSSPAAFLQMSETISHFTDKNVKENKISGDLRHAQPISTYQKLIEDEKPSSGYSSSSQTFGTLATRAYPVVTTTQSKNRLYAFDKKECETTALRKKDINCRLRKILNQELERKQIANGNANPLIVGYLVYSTNSSTFI
ncbi:unnamed protein product, partial [Amoebophrya sp. A120]